MEAMQVGTPTNPCGRPLREGEVPLINTMVTCLGTEHRKLDVLIMQLALAATRLAADTDAVAASQRAVEVWHEIRRNLWSHLQIEDELVFSWGEEHRAIPAALLDALQVERQAMHELIGALPAASSTADREPQTAEDRRTFAHTLLA